MLRNFVTLVFLLILLSSFTFAQDDLVNPGDKLVATTHIGTGQQILQVPHSTANEIIQL